MLSALDPRPSTSFGLLFLFWTLGCTTNPQGPFSSQPIPAPPDYDDLTYWAAHPEKEDPADRTAPALWSEQEEAEADVFFLHPTMYTGDRGEDQWNGPVDNPDLNEEIDEGPIKHQASIFNGAGRIFAPRYRQAHLEAYYTEKEASAERAFELAYQDVAAAFEYYLKHYNQGRPIVIAAHSQGTTHARRLLKEYFDGKSLQDQLVVAYLVGIGVRKDEFENIPVCQTPTETGCFCSWRTWKTGKEPKKWVSPQVAVTNPISWTTDTELVPRSEHQGAILRDFNKMLPELVNAQINAELGILWTDRPKLFGAIFLMGNYHIADFNLFYYDVWTNAKRRVRAFLGRDQG